MSGEKVCENVVQRQEEEEKMQEFHAGQLRGNSAFKKNGGVANVSEGTLPSFLDCKGGQREMCFQPCKILLQ